MSDIGRPSTKSQSSRKGKKAWRKNVDISDLEKKIEEQREEIIEHGAVITEASSEDLFFIDEDADEGVEEKLIKNNIKKLKASEILSNKSKVPALYDSKVSKQKNKIQGVSKKDMVKLLKLAGKVKGYDKYEERLSEDGIIKQKAFDVWGTLTAEEKRLAELPQPLREQSGSSFTAASIIPKTLKEAPVKVKHIEEIPHAGKSYNPTYENWRDLINKEYFKEKSLEDKRLELEEFHTRLQYIMEHDHHSEVESSDDDEDQEEKEEENEEQDDDEKYRLSVNAVTERKIKTKSKRNKEKRHVERVKIENEIKALKAHIKELEKLPKILETVATIENNQNSKPSETKGERKLRRGTRKLGKFDVIDGPIEVKLSNELSDSLRKLKPEGNLLYDQMKRMQAKGKIETRRGRDRKQGKKKVTEKWTYKDFK